MGSSKGYQTFKIVFYIIFGVYHLLLVIFTFDMDRSLSLMIKILPYMKYGALFGLLLFFTDLAIGYLQLRPLKKEIKAKEQQVLNLKAKLYDKGEAKPGKDLSEEEKSDENADGEQKDNSTE